jgi:hypothetical protein
VQLVFMTSSCHRHHQLGGDAGGRLRLRRRSLGTDCGAQRRRRSFCL